MYSIRRWFLKPKKEDSSKLAQFFWADEELNMVAAELDSFDGRKDPERCSALVNQLRLCQDKVLTICSEIMNEAIPDARANRDFQSKFPDDVLQENLAGQLWFGAECLAAGSNILNRESESSHMRPLAKALTRALDNVRFLLREQCLKNPNEYTDKVNEALWIFDRLFADFELCYVSAMVPVKSPAEFHMQQEVVVLFSETLHRALKLGLVHQDLVDYCDPSLMFTIPRLAIVCGLLIFPDGPLKVDKNPEDMSELFRPFFSLLYKIRDLLWTLSVDELLILEKTLCSLEDPEVVLAQVRTSSDALSNFTVNGIQMYPPPSQNCQKGIANYAAGYYSGNCKQFIQDFYSYNFGPPQELKKPESKQEEGEEESLKIESPNRTSESLSQNQNTVGKFNLTGPMISAVAHRLGGTQYSTPNKSGRNRDSISSEEDYSAPVSEEVTSHSLPAVSSLRQQIASSSSRHFTSPVRTEGGARFRRRRGSTQGSLKGSTGPIAMSRLGQLRQTGESGSPMRGDYSASISSFSSCSSITSLEWELESGHSSETSSYRSECQDDQEIALALQAAEIASCHKARARFKDSTDLIHRLFVCISGVADQLQTNFASDLRNILKCVFHINASHTQTEEEESQKTPVKPCEEVANLRRSFQQELDNQDYTAVGRRLSDPILRIPTPAASELEDEEDIVDIAEEAESVDASEQQSESPSELIESQNLMPFEDAPCWLPDDFVDSCMACKSAFTLLRRRHHCRNCGKIFCSRCSSNCIPLPRFGHVKPVRVCNTCFVCHVTQLLVMHNS